MSSREAAVAAPSRRVPPVNRFLDDPRVAAFEGILGRETLKEKIALVLDSARSGRDGVATFESLRSQILSQLQDEHAQSLCAVINGTGVLLHTNLGRAPLAPQALRAVQRVAGGYSNLEYDLGTGRRGSRYSHATTFVKEVTGAQDALVVNNCAAAVLLILDTFAKGKDVVIARSELIEIGGGFRLPEVLQRTGARLVEVGATNKVYLRDYEHALTAQTALLMRAHPSNYRISGFTHGIDPTELVALGKRAGVGVIEDLGSGALFDLAPYGLPHERTAGEAIADGIDLVTFSGDKMLGGPQAGIIAGRSTFISRLRSNPLLRALRVDKMTLAALIETLRIAASPQRRNEIPFFAMLGRTLDELRARADRYVHDYQDAKIIQSEAYAGGGSLPESAIGSVAVALSPNSGPDAAAATLRSCDPPIIARIEGDRLLLDLRTIDPAEDPTVISALQKL